jgi:type I restriction-modification system DNA methylase subunit
MSLFQKSVEKKYLNELDTVLVDSKYKDFQHYFGNPAIQENIRNSKEEQFQEGFLRELFVSVFGYTLNPNPNFNLTTELKNIANSKKADGAILKGEDAIAVIELKGTDTTDLDKIEAQAFGYKNHHPKCVYVITSNFEKLRFYIQNAVEHLDFDLFNLTREQFSLLWLCLAKDNLINGLPLKIKESSVLQEENITKKLYTDYSKFREAIYTNLVKNNPETDKLLLFKKTQKLLDRFLFIFFAEDRLLLPPNSISEIVKQWTSLKEEHDEYFSLYSRFKKYFGYMNTGYKGKKYDIYAYNGGLFEPDEILDNITIDDDILFEHTRQLSNYDFETDVDVNILGHIFEHSLGEIENVQAEIQGEKVDSQKTKRKKDGIFYTPKYITKYIVENTVGKLCEEKRAKLGIVDEEYAKGRKNRKKELVKSLDKKLEDYRNWLLSLTILDPACGSGAFLNQALDFLIKEHRKIDELKSQLAKQEDDVYALIHSDYATDILEKNIYGVDINEESVEIAKLSLWLRTAQKGRKLNKLNNNIKCGNSLIDDPDVAGEKAFHWQNEFPEIFTNGGFDVVIGNPPYGAKLEKSDKDFLKQHYHITEYNYDTYNFFFELSLRILKANSYLGFITPNTFLVVENGILLRKLLFQENKLIELYETFNVFPDAVVEPITSIIRKSPSNKLDDFNVLLDTRDKSNLVRLSFNYEHIFRKESLVFNYRETKEQRNLYSKLLSTSNQLSDFACVKAGIKPYEKGKGNPPQSQEIVNEKPFNSYIKYDDSWYKLIRGTQINRYKINWDGEYLKYGEWLAAQRNPNSFFNNKIVIRRTDDKILAAYDENKYVGLNSIHCLQLTGKEIDYKYLLALINSKLCNWFFRHENFHMVGKPLAEVKVVFVERLPIRISENQLDFIVKADEIISKNEQLYELSKSFVQFLISKMSIHELGNKLENWHQLEFKDFLKELQKAKIKLSLSEEAEWMNYFNEQKQIAQTLKAEIDKTDREIDRMVYALYGLTEEEIRIVEESAN